MGTNFICMGKSIPPQWKMSKYPQPITFLVQFNGITTHTGMLFLVFVSYFHSSCYNVRVDSLCCSRRSLLKWIPNKMVSSYLKTHWCDCPVWHHCRNLNVNSVNLWLDAMYFRIKKEKNISRFKPQCDALSFYTFQVMHLWFLSLRRKMHPQFNKKS